MTLLEEQELTGFMVSVHPWCVSITSFCQSLNLESKPSLGDNGPRRFWYFYFTGAIKQRTLSANGSIVRKGAYR